MVHWDSDQDGDAEYQMRAERRRTVNAAANHDEQVMRDTAQALWRELQRAYQAFTEGIEIDATSFGFTAVALSRTVNLAQEVRLESAAQLGRAPVAA